MKQNLLGMLCLILGLTACTPPLVENEELSLPVKPSVEIEGDQMVLGKKLDNPYTYDNMQSVYDEWCHEVGCTPVPLEFSHYYVRFLPKNSNEMRLLESYDIAFFDYPMDYEILKEGNFYVDPTTKDNYCTWLYTSVPADFEFPNMEYELIEKCFIPEELEYENLHLSANSSEYLKIEELLYRAYDRVGAAHLFEIPQESTQNSNDLRKGWFDWIRGYKPKGTITVYDTTLDDYSYVKGVKILAHAFVHWSSSYTDNNGYYKLPSRFFTNASYRCIFKNQSGFRIYDEAWVFWPATYNMGWHSKKGFSRKIKTNTPAWDWATINNAVVYYRKYCDQKSILKPFNDLRIMNFRHYGKSSAPMLHHMPNYLPFRINSVLTAFLAFQPSVVLLNVVTQYLQPDITIGSKGYDSMSVFRKVCHELSHSSHFKLALNTYNNSYGKMFFWEDYVSYIMNNNGYGDRSCSNSGICGVGEMWGYAMDVVLSEQKYSKHSTDLKSKWFKPIIIHQLISEGVLTPNEIFVCMTNNIRSHKELKDILMATYDKKVLIIEKAFNDHGF